MSTARPVGRVLRFVVGAALVAQVVALLSGAATRLSVQALGVVVVLATVYVAIHVGVNTYRPTLNRWLGAVLALLPLGVVFSLMGAPGQIGVLAFVGLSLLLAGLRGDAGCEVMALPGILFGRQTHLMCLLFCPIDWLEGKLPERRADS